MPNIGVIPELPDYMSSPYIDDDIKKMFEGTAHMTYEVPLMQLVKEMRLSRQGKEFNDVLGL